MRVAGKGERRKRGKGASEDMKRGLKARRRKGEGNWKSKAQKKQQPKKKGGGGKKTISAASLPSMTQITDVQVGSQRRSSSDYEYKIACPRRLV